MISVITFSCCVLIVLNESCQAKVCNLTDEFMRDQDVCCSQVSMDVISLLNEGHAIGHLQGAAHHQVRPVSAVFFVLFWFCLFFLGLRDLQIIWVRMICLGRWAERFLNRGVNHFLLAVASSPHLHSSPTYPTQLNSCACLTSGYLKLQLYSEKVADTDRWV